MTEEQPDNTLDEILKEDKNGFNRGPGIGRLWVRLLLIGVLVFVGLYGFILFRQWRLDLEAKAIVSAQMTIEAGNNTGGEFVQEEEIAGTPEPEESGEQEINPSGTETVE